MTGAMCGTDDNAVVLTASRRIGDDCARSVRDRFVEAGQNPGPLRRLAGSACEFRVGKSVLAADLDAFHASGVDLDVNLVPVEGREKRLLVSDMDSTIISVECIDELADFAGVGAPVAAVTERAMQGELDFEEALAARVRLIAGLRIEDLEACHTERVHLNPGARTLVQTLKRRGAATILVSGGFTFFAERVARDAGFDQYHANRLSVEEGKLTGSVQQPVLGADTKAAILTKALRDLGLGCRDACAVGDGANDIEIVSMAGLGVAYRGKPKLREIADVRLQHSDLTAILALMGISETEWAT